MLNNRIKQLFLYGFLIQIFFGIPYANSSEEEGDILNLLIPATALGATLLYEEGYEGTQQFAKALGTSLLVTHILKETIHKRRPNDSCCESFPSGHAANVFTAASFIHKRYGLKYALIPYVGAIYTAHTRVEEDEHYTSDVIAGAAIGILSSFYFTKPYKGYQITPYAGNKTLGLNISRKW